MKKLVTVTWEKLDKLELEEWQWIALFGIATAIFFVVAINIIIGVSDWRYANAHVEPPEKLHSRYQTTDTLAIR